MPESSTTPPTIRVRISHARTQKEGWRCHETTIEVTGSANDYADMLDDIPDMLSDAHHAGLDEANRRNQVEGFTT